MSEHEGKKPAIETRVKAKRVVSRRDVLRGIGAFLASLGLASLPGAIPPPPGAREPIESSQEGLDLVSQIPVEITGPLLPEEFVFQNIEGMDVLGAEQALSKEGFEDYVESRKGKEVELNPEIRTTEFLVGSKAWRSWQNNERMKGEHLPPFLRRHIEGMNQVMDRTRPESGIRQMRMTGKIIVVDEAFLQGMEDWEKQCICSPDCFARWPIEADYWPEGNEKLGLKPSLYLHKDKETDLYFDDGLLHELLHYVFYYSAHLPRYFLRSDNWKSLLNVDLSAEGISSTFAAKQWIRLWQETEMQQQFRTRMLELNSFYSTDRQSPLGKADELYIRRLCLGTENLRVNKDVGKINERCLAADLDTQFKIKVPAGTTQARLYTATVDEFDARRDNISWRFGGKPTVLPVAANGEVILEGKSLAKGAKDSSDSSKEYSTAAKAFLLVVGKGEYLKIYGFTSWHLAYWHWLEQLEKGEQMIGADGKPCPVTLDHSEWRLW